MKKYLFSLVFVIFLISCNSNDFETVTPITPDLSKSSSTNLVNYFKGSLSFAMNNGLKYADLDGDVITINSEIITQFVGYQTQNYYNITQDNIQFNLVELKNISKLKSDFIAGLNQTSSISNRAKEILINMLNTYTEMTDYSKQMIIYNSFQLDIGTSNISLEEKEFLNSLLDMIDYTIIEVSSSYQQKSNCAKDAIKTAIIGGFSVGAIWGLQGLQAGAMATPGHPLGPVVGGLAGIVSGFAFGSVVGAVAGYVACRATR